MVKIALPLTARGLTVTATLLDGVVWIDLLRGLSLFLSGQY